MEIQSKFGWIVGGVLCFVLVLLLPLPNMTSSARVVLATACLMATWWLSEAIPIAATSLLPLVVFPFFGVLSSQQAATPYANHYIFLFLGGFFIAKAMERHGLHRRIALSILYILGCAQRKIVLGFILATAFLSMWISNTATAMIMLPIALSVIQNLGPSNEHFAKALFLGIAYGASVGGTVTLVGTPPNIVMAGQLADIFPKAPPISFTSWLAMGLPLAAIMIPVVWLVLCRIAFKVKSEDILKRELFKKEKCALGKMSREEKVVLCVFFMVSMGWLLRKDFNLGFVVIPGWSELLGLSGFVNDATVAIGGALILFIFPTKKKTSVLEWKTAVNIPWNVVLLFGGGFSLANAFYQSGLSTWIGSHIGAVGQLPVWVLVFLIAGLMTFLTEFTSNTATANLMLPVLASAALGMQTDPRLLMIPATFAFSLAFMLPVATPPNAIVFGSGHLQIKDMVKAGLLLNMIGALVILLVMLVVVMPLLDIQHGVLPPWSQ